MGGDSSCFVVALKASDSRAEVFYRAISCRPLSCVGKVLVPYVVALRRNTFLQHNMHRSHPSLQLDDIAFRIADVYEIDRPRTLHVDLNRLS